MKLLHQFEVYLKSTDRTASAQFYCSDLKRFTIWFETKYGSFDPAAITPLDLVEYRGYLQSSGGRRTQAHPSPQPAAPATINRTIISLSIFCQWAQEQGIIVTNPSKGIKPIPVEALAPHWLTRPQQAVFVRAVQAGQSLRDLAVCGLMLHASLRVSEVCALTRGDLALRQRSGGVLVHQGKGNKQRRVPLNVTIRKILLDYLVRLPESQQVLFASDQAFHLNPRAVQPLVKRYAYNAHLDSVSPHTLRHSFCKNLVDVGVSLDKVALLAGHTSLDVTRLYTTPNAFRLARPLTFNFIANLLEAVGAELVEVRIETIREGTFYAVAKLKSGDSVQEVDARPSDAIALALHLDSPVYVAQEVLERFKVDVPVEEIEKRQLGQGLENIMREIESQRMRQEQERQATLPPTKEDLHEAYQKLITAMFGSELD